MILGINSDYLPKMNKQLLVIMETRCICIIWGTDGEVLRLYDTFILSYWPETWNFMQFIRNVTCTYLGSHYCFWLHIGRPGFDPRQRQIIFLFRLCVQSNFEAHRASYAVDTGGPFPAVKVKRGRGVRLTTQPHLVPRSTVSRRYTSSPPWCSITVEGRLYFYLPNILSQTGSHNILLSRIIVFADLFLLLLNILLKLNNVLSQGGKVLQKCTRAA
jgi:hypothetical protein